MKVVGACRPPPLVRAPRAYSGLGCSGASRLQLAFRCTSFRLHGAPAIGSWNRGQALCATFATEATGHQPACPWPLWELVAEGGCHTIPDALQVDKSRKLTADDGKLLGVECCHKPKTVIDQGVIAKAKRVEESYFRMRAPKQKIKSAGFPKADRSEKTATKIMPGYRALFAPSAQLEKMKAADSAPADEQRGNRG